MRHQAFFNVGKLSLFVTAIWSSVLTAQQQGTVDTFITLLNETHALIQANKVQAAQQRGEEALALARKLGEPTYEASALGTLVGVYRLQGNIPKAADAGFRALTIAAQIPDARLCGTIHGDLLAVYAPEANKITREF